MTQYRDYRKSSFRERENETNRHKRAYTNHSQFGGPVSSRDGINPARSDIRPARSAVSSQYSRRNYVEQSQFARRVQVTDPSTKQPLQQPEPVYQGAYSRARAAREPKYNNPRVVLILSVVAAVLLLVIGVRFLVQSSTVQSYLSTTSEISNQQKIVDDANKSTEEIQSQINELQPTIDTYNKKKK